MTIDLVTFMSMLYFLYNRQIVNWPWPWVIRWVSYSKYVLILLKHWGFIPVFVGGSMFLNVLAFCVCFVFVLCPVYNVTRVSLFNTHSAFVDVYFFIWTINIQSISNNVRYWLVLEEFVEFEDTKGVIRIVYRRRTDNTVAKWKRTKGQTTINKACM